tara:strand:- start:579 stop:920 length:342 start_codon:yes stop_codon:yes gene_type:complete
MSTADNYQTPRNIVSYAYNISKHTAYSVPSEGRQKHEQCIYFALDQLNLGENCEWATRYALGNVQVMSHYPAGSGYCTTLISSVRYKGKSKVWKETACATGTGNNWTFIGSKN